jgi:hypothetical protein
MSLVELAVAFTLARAAVDVATKMAGAGALSGC